jgi:methane monooxygenase component C
VENYKIECNFEDGKSITFNCSDEDNLMTGAEKEGLSLVLGCRQGGCGTCKVRCTEGRVEHTAQAHIKTLPEAEREQGYLLSCVALPRSDLVIEFPYDSMDVGIDGKATSLVATVIGCEPLSDTVYRYQLQHINEESGQPEPIAFEAGQYMEINIPDSDHWRAFSMASVADDKGVMEFIIRLQEGGAFSSYLKESVQVGQRVSMNGPYGQFTIVPSNRTRAFVAGSTGLAPLVSMLRGMAAEGDTGEAHLFFGMADLDTFFYEKELKALEAELTNLTVHLCLTNPPENWVGETGTVVESFQRQFSGVGTPPDVYICGPEGMIKAAEEVCETLGIPAGQQFKEVFTPSART